MVGKQEVNTNLSHLQSRLGRRLMSANALSSLFTLRQFPVEWPPVFTLAS